MRALKIKTKGVKEVKEHLHVRIQNLKWIKIMKKKKKMNKMIKFSVWHAIDKRGGLFFEIIVKIIQRVSYLTQTVHSLMSGRGIS